MSNSDQVARWLESPEGERWSSSYHQVPHSGESHLANHIASVRYPPGEDPFWDLRMKAGRWDGRCSPEHDPSGRGRMAATADYIRAQEPEPELEAEL